MQIPDDLVEAVRARRAILFAGAGLSSSIGLPLFDVLTKHLAGELRIDAGDIGFAELAEFYLARGNSLERIVEWMRKTWHPENIDISRSRAHMDIVQLGFPAIYTTNYDSWIERAFAVSKKPFRKVVHVADLAKTQSSETEIIKFHGDLDDAESIILTESSFMRRMSLEEPLDIRLHSDSLARPILFVGYSLSDPNIRYLLFRLRQLWAEHAHPTERPSSFILMAERDPVREILLCNQSVEPIFSGKENPTEGLCKFFQELRKAAGNIADSARVS